MMKKTIKEKKVWIFKWLAEKHRCKVRLARCFFADKGKKREFNKIMLDREDGISFLLMTNKKPSSSSIRPKLAAVEVPAKWNTSYADVLEVVLKTMEKNGSDCWLVGRRHIGLFLKKGTSLEELEIEFDLTWRDIMTNLRRERKIVARSI